MQKGYKVLWKAKTIMVSVKNNNMFQDRKKAVEILSQWVVIYLLDFCWRPKKYILTLQLFFAYTGQTKQVFFHTILAALVQKIQTNVFSGSRFEVQEIEKKEFLALSSSSHFLLHQQGLSFFLGIWKQIACVSVNSWGRKIQTEI